MINILDIKTTAALYMCINSFTAGYVFCVQSELSLSKKEIFKAFLASVVCLLFGSILFIGYWIIVLIGLALTAFEKWTHFRFLFRFVILKRKPGIGYVEACKILNNDVSRQEKEIRWWRFLKRINVSGKKILMDRWSKISVENSEYDPDELS